MRGGILAPARGSQQPRVAQMRRPILRIEPDRLREMDLRFATCAPSGQQISEIVMRGRQFGCEPDRLPKRGRGGIRLA